MSQHGNWWPLGPATPTPPPSSGAATTQGAQHAQKHHAHPPYIPTSTPFRDPSHIQQQQQHQHQHHQHHQRQMSVQEQYQQHAEKQAKSYSEPVSAFSSAPPKGDPVKLFRDAREKNANDEYEDLSAVFSVITALERLENIWARRGAISKEEYERECESLIQQYGVLKSVVPKLDAFLVEYGIKATKAKLRLMQGVPATVYEPGRTEVAKGHQPKFVLRCTSLFHHVGTCIDMEQTQVGLLLPDLTSLMKTLVRVSALGSDFEFGKVIRSWVEKLNAMPAGVDLSREDAERLKLDLDNGYTEFESAITLDTAR